MSGPLAVNHRAGHVAASVTTRLGSWWPAIELVPMDIFVAAPFTARIPVRTLTRAATEADQPGHS
jgi:hypothetical protein